MTFFANTLECLNQALLVRCTHNQVRVKLDVCEREVQMYGRIYGWKSGRKRARAACGFYGQLSRLSERGEVCSWRRRGWGDEKCVSRGARRESLWVLRISSQPRSRPSEREGTSRPAVDIFLVNKNELRTTRKLSRWQPHRRMQPNRDPHFRDHTSFGRP